MMVSGSLTTVSIAFKPLAFDGEQSENAPNPVKRKASDPIAFSVEFFLSHTDLAVCREHFWKFDLHNAELGNIKLEVVLDRRSSLDGVSLSLSISCRAEEFTFYKFSKII